MAINFPNAPVNGNTYVYLGITYTWKQTGANGYWQITTPGTYGLASREEIAAGIDNAKYITPYGLAGSADGPLTHHHLEEHIEDLDRQRWKGVWISTLYAKNDEARQGGWLGVSLVDDNGDQLAPQPIGDPTWLFEGSLISAQTSAKDVWVGTRLTFPENLYYNAYKARDLIVGNHYEIYFVEEPQSANPVWNLLASFTATVPGDNTTAVSPVIIVAGSEYDLLLHIQEPNPTPTTWNDDWTYSKPNNETPPLQGQIVQSTKTPGILNVHYLANLGVDRTTDLQALSSGDLIDAMGVTWSIQSTTDRQSYIDLIVAPASQGASIGLTNFVFETTAIVPISYSRAVDGYLPRPGVQGLFSDTGSDNLILSNDAFNMDANLQYVNVSDKWDIKSSSDVSGGGKVADGIGEAPDDGFPYSRQNKIWTEAPALGHGHQDIIDQISVTLHSNTKAYVKDDLVEFEGSIYHCTVPHDSEVFSLTNFNPISGAATSGVTFNYNWSTTLTGQLPTGRYGLNNADPTLATQVRVSSITNVGNDASVFWESAADGDYFMFIEDTGGAESNIFQISGPFVEQVGTPNWFEAPASHIDSVGVPENNRKGFLSFVSNPDNRLPVGGATDDVLAKAGPGNYDTQWVTLDFALNGHKHDASDITTGVLGVVRGGTGTQTSTGTGDLVLATSPALLGSPTAPTQLSTDSSGKLATTKFVSDKEIVSPSGIIKAEHMPNYEDASEGQVLTAKKMYWVGASMVVNLPNATTTSNGDFINLLTDYTTPGQVIAFGAQTIEVEPGDSRNQVVLDFDQEVVLINDTVGWKLFADQKINGGDY